MFKLSDKTIAILEDIENRIDPEVEIDFRNQWEDFLYDRFTGDLFKANRKKLAAPAVDLPSININDALADYDLMLQSQLAGVSKALNSQHTSLSIRANYGTGILSSIFGAEIFTMPREMNTLPTTRSINDTEWIRDAVERGMPDLNTGFGRNVLEFGEILAEVLTKYPKISKYLNVYHPDLQGPLDICELLWGGEMFYAMYDEPELVHAALSLVTDTYTELMKKWFDIFPPSDVMNSHWSMFFRGTIFIRNDSAMNLSPDLYDEFSAPYDSILLDRFNGGAVHFCGRGDHYIKSLCSIPKMYAINLTQPEYNDMETIYANTVDKGIKMLELKYSQAQSDLSRPGGLGHNVSV